MHKHLLSLVGLATLAAGFALAVPVYENDFTTRTSAPIPTSEWLELPYVVGNLAEDYSSTAPSSLTPFSGIMFQDSWFKATIGNTYVPSAYVVSVNSSDTGTAEGDTNPYFRYGHSADVCKVTAVATTFYNSFSTGVLRFQVDMRAPATWPSGNGFVRIQPIGAASLASPNWATAPLTFTHFGLQKPNNGPQELTTVMPIASSGDGSGGNASINQPGTTFAQGHWYRFVIDMDLSNNKFSGTFYDQGIDHPELTDAHGEQKHSYSNMGAYYTIQNAGAIEGFMIRLSDIKTSNPVTNKSCPCIDNIICSWKAPGAADFVRFYENDFKTRRYRRLAPAATDSHTYTRDLAATTSTAYSPYVNITATTTTNLVNQILPAYDANNTVRQAEGCGGWRRTNIGNATVGVVTYGSGNPALRFSDGTGETFAIAAQTLGESVTSGKVRLSYDVRTPDRWYWASNAGAYAMLGTDALWGAHNLKVAAASLSRYGIQAPASKTTQFNVTVIDNGSSQIDETVSLKPNTWYRVIQVADLDTWTMSGAIYEIGDAPIGIDAAAGSQVHEVTGATMRGEKTEVSAFALAAYGAGASTQDNPPHLRHVYFDNVKVWKNWDEGAKTGDLVYRDDFKTATRYYAPQVRGKVIGTHNNDDGQDHWIRRNDGSGSVWITSGANPCVAAGDPASHSYAVQDLGVGYKDRVTVQADMRSPASWLWSNSHAAQIDVGGDRFLNGNRGTASVAGNLAFSSFMYGAFGFGTDENLNGVGFYPSSKLRFSTLNDKNEAVYTHPKTLSEAEKSHWFRFKVKYDLGKGTYSVRVYDQGEHPASASTPNGSLYYSASGLKMRTAAEPRGITSICLNTYGNQYVNPGDPEDPGLALYDNLVVREDGGLTIIFR